MPIHVHRDQHICDGLSARARLKAVKAVLVFVPATIAAAAELSIPNRHNAIVAEFHPDDLKSTDNSPLGRRSQLHTPP
jgi:hypothetical protein